MISTRPLPRPPGARRAPSVLKAAAAIAVLSVALAGCGAVPQSIRISAKPEVDPRLGVAPSPRVVAFGEPVPKGGGRSMVGKPYKVAGKRYVPRHDPDYKATGYASWYGDAFHGRKTANGEVFDANHLSAAHPTMPLPSYARVTSVDTGRSVIVRVNDRGPFHSNRVLDLSRRTAEMLGVRNKGVAKVSVAYVGPAPVQGDDTEYLMASYRGPANVPTGMPETMFASAAPLPGVAVKGAPAPIAAEPAVPAMTVVAALPRERPMVFEAYVQMASIDPADVVVDAAPVVVAAADVPSGWQVGAQPVSYQPGSPIVEPAALVDYPIPMPSPRSSYAADRIAGAYAAVETVGGDGMGLGALARRLDDLAAGRGATGAVVQVGLFADPANAARIVERLAGVGVAAVDDVTVGGRSLKRVRLTALAVGVTAEDAAAAAERAGARGAQVLR